MIFQATCKLGVEALVATELRKLGIEPVSVDSAKIRFEGDYLTMARACLWLRTAERVLLEVGRFEAHTFTDLFEGVKALDWKQYLAKDAFIHVVGKSAKSDLFSVKDCQSVTKKAIVENLKAASYTIDWISLQMFFPFFNGKVCRKTFDKTQLIEHLLPLTK